MIAEKSEDRGDMLMDCIFDILPPEIIIAICEFDPVTCQRLWKYLPDRGEIRSSRDWAAVFATTEIIDNVIMTRLYGEFQSICDRPAITSARAAGWYHRGELHREGGPAIIIHDAQHSWYVPNINVEYLLWVTVYGPWRPASFWFLRGKLDRSDSMNVIEYITTKYSQLHNCEVCVDWVEGSVKIILNDVVASIDDIRVTV